jgi:proline iminopeptidase
MSGVGYPPVEPCESGMLEVGDGNHVYWEVSGNPRGKPAVVLHGGPGAGSSPFHRRLFDPGRYRVVLFDQRGCGRSTPHASHPAARLDSNTTWHLVADIERLRVHLGIDRWLVLGGSWGTVLALAYAQTHPGRVSQLVLTGVCAQRRKEIEWYWGGGAAFLFPEAWERFLAPLPSGWRKYPQLIEAYTRLLDDPDPAVRQPAITAWTRWGQETMTLDPDSAAEIPAPDTRADYAAARICIHYIRHNAWLRDDQLIAGAGALATMPGVMVQGRYDVQAPATTAWELARAWPAAELILVTAGHSAREPAIARELLRATDRFATYA